MRAEHQKLVDDVTQSLALAAEVSLTGTPRRPVSAS